MTQKFADFCISAVRYNKGSTHIDQLEVWEHDVQNNKLANKQILSRTEVVQLIQKGKTFVTIVKQSNGNYSKGAPVQIFPVTIDYLRTAADKKSSDNLENLPEF